MFNMRSLIFVLALAASVCVVWSAKDHPIPAENCKGMETEDLLERVKIEPKCGKNRCKFRKGTNATISLQFKPVCCIISRCCIGPCPCTSNIGDGHGYQQENRNQTGSSEHPKPVLRKPCTRVRGKLHFDYEVKTLTIDVFGIVSELSLPFIGVTGSSACGQVTRVDTGEPADCPLAPDVEYSYSKSFPIETFYPSLNVRVHWALVGDEGNIICLEVPAVIK